MKKFYDKEYKFIVYKASELGRGWWQEETEEGIIEYFQAKKVFKVFI